MEQFEVGDTHMQTPRRVLHAHVEPPHAREHDHLVFVRVLLGKCGLSWTLLSCSKDGQDSTETEVSDDCCVACRVTT